MTPFEFEDLSNVLLKHVVLDNEPEVIPRLLSMQQISTLCLGQLVGYASCCQMLKWSCGYLVLNVGRSVCSFTYLGAPALHITGPREL